MPVPVVIFLAAAAVAAVVLRYTRFGQHVYATGGNRLAAEMNGVPTKRIIFLVYVIVGFTCGLATFLLSARLSSAEAVAGTGLELTVIAAVVIGGTSLFGGVGSIGGTLVGVLLIGSADQWPGAAQRVVLRPADRGRPRPDRGRRIRSVRDP